MAMGEANRAVVRRWCGNLDGDGWDNAEAAYARLASPYAAALQLLMERRGAMAWHVVDIASASDRSNHKENLKALNSQIDGLLAEIASDPDLAFGTAAQALIDAANAPNTPGLASVPYQSRNIRVS